MDDDKVAQLVAAVGAAVKAMEPPGHNELMQAVVDTAREIFGAAACSIAMVDDAAEFLVYRFASGEGADRIVGEQLPLGRGIAGWVASSGASIAVDDVGQDPRFAREVAERTGYVPRGILAAPLEARDSVLGVISVLDRRLPADGAEAQRDMTILGLLARQVSMSMESAQIFDDAARLLTAVLGEVSGDVPIADALAAAAEAAHDTRGELADLATAFARLRGLDSDLASLAADTVDRFAIIASRRQPW
ncbi:MAG TPA: GAF domain-containing protein [Mycobacteriales bacterium]|nr:GAF domain-containing protein [Mycobacteriales bacterium]